MKGFFSHCVSSSEGLTLIEVLVSVALFLAAVTAMVTAGSTSLRASDLSLREARATEFAKQGIEAIREIRDNGSVVDSSDGTVWSFDTAEWDTSSGGTYYSISRPGSAWQMKQESIVGLPKDAAEFDIGEGYRRWVEVVDVQGDSNVKEVTITVYWNFHDVDYEVTMVSFLANWR